MCASRVCVCVCVRVRVFVFHIHVLRDSNMYGLKGKRTKAVLGSCLLVELLETTSQGQKPKMRAIAQHIANPEVATLVLGTAYKKRNILTHSEVQEICDLRIHLLGVYAGRKFLVRVSPRYITSLTRQCANQDRITIHFAVAHGQYKKHVDNPQRNFVCMDHAALIVLQKRMPSRGLSMQQRSETSHSWPFAARILK